MSDLIYRQDAIDAINAYLGLSAVSRTIQNMTSIEEILKNLPSAEPRKRGKWIEIKHTFFHKCSQCSWLNDVDSGYDFCPNCGSYNRGEEE